MEQILVYRVVYEAIPTNFTVFAWQNPVCVALCVAKPGLRGDLRGTLRGLTLEGYGLIHIRGYG